MKGKVAALVADAFQDSEYFLPKVALQDQLGLEVEVVSSGKAPIEIWSYFKRIGLLDVDRAVEDANPSDYLGVLVPGGARSPALLAEDPRIIAFLRVIDEQQKLVAAICRGPLLVAVSGIAQGRHLTGFCQESEYPDLVIRPTVEAYGGIWSDYKPVVVDGNLVSSRHPNDIEHFTSAIRRWVMKRERQTVDSR